jgi:hypothetical protein
VQRDEKAAYTDPIVPRLLEQFAQEERDVSWAQMTELHLREVFASAQGVTVRWIECRTSICIYEVAYAGQGNYNIGSDNYLVDEIRLEGTIFAFEDDATNLRFTVALEVYSRDNQ